MGPLNSTKLWHFLTRTLFFCHHLVYYACIFAIKFFSVALPLSTHCMESEWLWFQTEMLNVDFIAFCSYFFFLRSLKKLALFLFLSWNNIHTSYTNIWRLNTFFCLVFSTSFFLMQCAQIKLTVISMWCMELNQRVVSR